MERVLSLAPSNTQVLLALGLGESLVGVTEYCPLPPGRPIPVLKGWVAIPPEKILGLEPDLVVTSTVCQEALRRELSKAGVRLLHLDPRDLAGVEGSFIQIGRALGREGEARALVEKFRAEGEAVRRAARGRPRPRLYCEEWQKPPAVSGNWVPELARAAGADYFPLAAGQLSRPVSPAEIQAFDPQIVILSICGMGLKPDPAQVLSREGWEAVEAVREKRVFTLEDSLLNCPGPALWEGARALQAVLEACRSQAPLPAGLKSGIRAI